MKLQQLVKDEDYQQVISMLQKFHVAYFHTADRLDIRHDITEHH